MGEARYRGATVDAVIAVYFNDRERALKRRDFE